LDPEHSLLSNSVGLLFCSRDFVFSGAVEAVSKALPFETIGCATSGIAVPGATGEALLTVAALTSDEVVFKTGVSDSLKMDGEPRIRELYERLGGSAESAPSLLFVCHSNPEGFAGDTVMRILDSASGGAPVFGTNALDETFGSLPRLVIHNGRSYSDRLVLLALCGGKLESRFDSQSLPAMNIHRQPALVTEAQDNRIISINNMPAAEFMEKNGVISEGRINALHGFPLLVNNND
jgi:hypothetical protein